MEMQRLIKNLILLCPHVGVPREDHRFVIFSLPLSGPLAPSPAFRVNSPSLFVKTKPRIATNPAIMKTISFLCHRSITITIYLVNFSSLEKKDRPLSFSFSR